MTIERSDLRRDNHELLRRVQVVWQDIEQGSLMPRVKVVSLIHSTSSSPPYRAIITASPTLPGFPPLRLE
jgi:ABC-type dipeptide/oligopeptide/nickel transport system ATPase subunit